MPLLQSFVNVNQVEHELSCNTHYIKNLTHFILKTKPFFIFNYIKGTEKQKDLQEMFGHARPSVPTLPVLYFYKYKLFSNLFFLYFHAIVRDHIYE